MRGGYDGERHERENTIHLCDREPEKTEDAMKQIEGFSRHFIRVYGEETDPDELGTWESEIMRYAYLC